MQTKSNSLNGFTLLEILVAMGLVAVLAGVTVAAINPGRQFALARNTQRKTDLAAIVSAITQNMVEHQGKFECSKQLPENYDKIASSNLNIRECLVPNYLSEIPVDPESGEEYKDNTYNTNYEIKQDKITKRISLKAPDAELEQHIEFAK